LRQLDKRGVFFLRHFQRLGELGDLLGDVLLSTTSYCAVSNAPAMVNALQAEPVSWALVWVGLVPTANAAEDKRTRRANCIRVGNYLISASFYTLG